jgi:hypothetical protein
VSRNFVTPSDDAPPGEGCATFLGGVVEDVERPPQCLLWRVQLAYGPVG